MLVGLGEFWTGAMPHALNGLRVVSFESRRSAEMAELIRNYGGEPIQAPAMREVPLTDQREALAFGETLLAGDWDVLILLTGVGTPRARTRAPPGSWHRPFAVRAWRFWLDDRITRLEFLAVLSAVSVRSSDGTCTGT